MLFLLLLTGCTPLVVQAQFSPLAAPERATFAVMQQAVQSTPEPDGRGVGLETKNAASGFPFWNGCPVWIGQSELDALGADWLYDWSNIPPVFEGVESVPMLWPALMVNGQCPTLGGNSSWLLGFNEPELMGMTPHDGAILWHQLEGCYPGMRYVSPATVTDHGWLAAMRDEHMALYGHYPQWDALAFHVYAFDRTLYENAVDALATMTAYADSWGIDELWVTEFATTDIQDMQRTLLLFEGYPRIKRVAWFIGQDDFVDPSRDTSLVTCDYELSLTAFGEVYAEFEARRVYVPVVTD
jgi:hypothetical protein